MEYLGRKRRVKKWYTPEMTGKENIRTLFNCYWK